MPVSYQPLDLNPPVNGALVGVFDDQQVNITILVRFAISIRPKKDYLFGLIACDDLTDNISDHLRYLIRSHLLLHR